MGASSSRESSSHNITCGGTTIAYDASSPSGFVARFDASGACVWIDALTPLDSNSYVDVRDIAVGPGDAIYVAGQMNGSMSLAGVMRSSATPTGYLLRVDAAGASAKVYPPKPGSYWSADAVTVNASGHVFVAANLRAGGDCDIAQNPCMVGTAVLVGVDSTFLSFQSRVSLGAPQCATGDSSINHLASIGDMVLAAGYSGGRSFSGQTIPPGPYVAKLTGVPQKWISAEPSTPFATALSADAQGNAVIVENKDVLGVRIVKLDTNGTRVLDRTYPGGGNISANRLSGCAVGDDIVVAGNSGNIDFGCGPLKGSKRKPFSLSFTPTGRPSTADCSSPTEEE